MVEKKKILASIVLGSVPILVVWSILIRYYLIILITLSTFLIKLSPLNYLDHDISCKSIYIGQVPFISACIINYELLDGPSSLDLTGVLLNPVAFILLALGSFRFRTWGSWVLRLFLGFGVHLIYHVFYLNATLLIKHLCSPEINEIVTVFAALVTVVLPFLLWLLLYAFPQVSPRQNSD